VERAVGVFEVERVDGGVGIADRLKRDHPRCGTNAGCMSKF
jgi:hypothetical protein